MQEFDVIYDRYGRPVLRILSNGRVVDFYGNSCGFIKNDSVFNYNGWHVAWYEKGILRDELGNVVGFGVNPTDYPRPLLPLKGLKPVSSFVQLEPLRPLTQLPPLKPLKSFYWSDLEPFDLFK